MSPERSSRFSPRWQSRIDDLLDDAVVGGDVPGVVAVVGDAHGAVYRRAVGSADLRTGRPMVVDTVFPIASQTKLVTAIVALQLVEQGALSLDAPVDALLPEFGKHGVLLGFRGRAPVVSPTRGRARIRDLLTHTSGVGYATWHPESHRFAALTGLADLGSGKRSALNVPLVAEPGTSFHYGMGMDWLGLVIEKITGGTIAEAFRRLVFEPLGMQDTSTWIKTVPAMRARAAAVHVRQSDGGWCGTDADYWAPDVTDPEFLPAGHCLYGTATDYLRLQQLLLGGGRLGDVRLLRPETADLFFENQIGDLEVGVIPTADPAASRPIDLRGWKWSLGLLVNPTEVDGFRSAESAGWAGGFNTFYWVDRRRGLAAGLYTATLPFYDSAVSALADSFEQAVSRES